jgi:predicted Zn-dependent protease
MMIRLVMRMVCLAGIALLGTVAPIRAQLRTSIPVTVHGQVHYSSGAAADNVTVRLELFSGGIQAEAQTDRLGKFRFTNLAPAMYYVTVHMPGYLDAQQQVDLQTNITEYVMLQLVPDKSDSANNSTVTGVINVSVPPKARAEFDLGRAAMLADKADEGIAHLEKAVQIFPGYAEAQLLLGTAYMDKGAWDKAENTLRHARKLEPKMPVVFFALGEVYFRQKKYKEAEANLVEGLKLDDKSVPGHFALGRVYYATGNLVKAGPHVGRALQLKPDFAEGHLLAGNILLRAKQPEYALAQFEAYVLLAPQGQYAEQARAKAEKIRQALGVPKGP